MRDRGIDRSGRSSGGGRAPALSAFLDSFAMGSPAMSWWQAVLVVVAGIGAGTINTVVGSGTLITFPVLLGVGLPPVTANVSNAVGLFPGSFVGAYGYRRELRGQSRRVAILSSPRCSARSAVRYCC